QRLQLFVTHPLVPEPDLAVPLGSLQRLQLGQLLGPERQVALDLGDLLLEPRPSASDLPNRARGILRRIASRRPIEPGPAGQVLSGERRAMLRLQRGELLQLL